MKILAEKIRKLISDDTFTPVRSKSHPFDFIKNRKGILRELMISKEAGNLIGMISPALGEGMFLILVLCIEFNTSDEVIAFQKYDISDGRILSAARLSINEIKGVCPFNYK